jgi:hypothetical protein
MPELAELLAQRVSFGGAGVPFGDVTVDQARERADELRSVVGFGPTARVAPVARAWRELTMALEAAGVGRVGELAPETITELAPKLWIVPPGGSLL